MAFITVLNALRQHLYFNLLNWAMTRPGAYYVNDVKQIIWDAYHTVTRHAFLCEEMLFSNFDFRREDERKWKRVEVDWRCYLGVLYV